MKDAPEFCPCEHGKPDPCPACGATVKGDDPVHGLCQARKQRPIDYGLRLVVTDRDTGKEITR